MATIGRFSGRAPWLSMAAFGITGCLTALCHGSAAGAKSSSTSKQQVANYYSSSASTGDSSPKRSSASSSSARSARKSVSSGKATAKASASGSRSSAKGKTSSKYVKSSELNYYSQPAHSGVSPAHGQQQYEAGAVTASRDNGVYSSSHVQGSAPVYYSSQTPIVNTSAVGQVQQEPQEQKRSFFGRAFQKSTSAVKSVGTAIRPCRYTGTTQTGKASWYGGRFHGGKTANGERYDMNSMTAAHRTLPFGTLVKVKNLINGRECVVRINNRGPFIKGRILDMSKAAASELGFMGRGIVKVHMQVLGVDAR